MSCLCMSWNVTQSMYYSQTPNASRQGRHPPLFSAPALEFACSHCLFVPWCPTCWLGAWLVLGAHHAWADCMPTLFPQTCKFLCINDLLFAWTPHNWPWEILMCGTWKQCCPHNIATDHTTSLCCCKNLILCVVALASCPFCQSKAHCTSQHMSVAYVEHPAPLQ